MFTGKTLEELLVEAEVEENAGSRRRNTQLKRYPSFNQTLEEKGLAKSTVN